MTRKAVAALAVLGLIAAGCSKKAASSTPSGSSPSASTAPSSAAPVVASPFNDHGTKDVSSASKIEIEADDFYFNPSILQGKPGEKLTVELKNESGTKHNFTLDAQKIDTDLDPHKDATITVTFPASGSLEFHCEYHGSMGMKGALVVS